MGKELGISDDMWSHIEYKGIIEQDKTMIQWASDDEETVTGNRDWAVKLGTEIFYSAKLGCCAFNRKQMPYNAFRQDSPSKDQSGRHKKIIVAGRWCGKVWMSNQVHPMLIVKDDDDDYHSEFSHGFNGAEAVNMGTPGWLRVARDAAIRRVSIDIAPIVSDSQLLYDLAMPLSSRYN
uniref:Uncharacterized protein n=1 Tax=Helianthus annuus TaxID=4232 RepID=A0A251T8D7_HELAN